MKERPILFSGPMVRAILEGRKTQTRRVVKPQPVFTAAQENEIVSAFPGSRLSECMTQAWLDGWVDVQCPYGQPGDRPWVREPHYVFGHWEPVPTRRTRTGRQKWRFVADPRKAPLYEPPTEYRKGRHHKDPYTPAWHARLGRFMPRALSRLSLEITESRVQRLQEISEADARAEGVVADDISRVGVPCRPARGRFEELWDSINGERPGCSWEKNPWVWCLTFRVLK
jgi:hypothetical protein